MLDVAYFCWVCGVWFCGFWLLVLIGVLMSFFVSVFGNGGLFICWDFGFRFVVCVIEFGVVVSVFDLIIEVLFVCLCFVWVLNWWDDLYYWV